MKSTEQIRSRVAGAAGIALILGLGLGAAEPDGEPPLLPTRPLPSARPSAASEGRFITPEPASKDQRTSHNRAPRRALTHGERPAVIPELPTRGGAKRQPDLKKAEVIRMPLQPLPTNGTVRRPLGVATSGNPFGTEAADCAADRARGQAQARVDAAGSQPAREAALLELAGAYVGLDDWASARDIYEHLLAVSQAEPIRAAADRNLLVVRQQISMSAEPDRNRRDELTSELAELHLALGHQQAGERFLKALARDAQDGRLRREATERLRQFGKSAGPPRSSAGEDQQPESAEAK